MNDSNELDFAVNDILSQLKQVPAAAKKAAHSGLNKEDLEKFILDNASKLIITASEAMEEVKDFVSSAPDAESVDALASLINANATALETLNRLLIADKRNKTMIQIKEMDVNSRKQQLDTAIGAKLLLTREELMKNLLNSAFQPAPIEAEYTTMLTLSS